MYEVKHMKWWGWGDEDVTFDANAHPGLWPYAQQQLGAKNVTIPPVPIEAIFLNEATRNRKFEDDLRSFLVPNQIANDRYQRVIHAYGKGFRDLFRLRQGSGEGAPDMVLYPETENEVSQIIRAAAEYDVAVIPFGGGSNIAGCLERSTSRMTVSLDMRRLRKVQAVDRESFVARIEAGIFGPDLEEQLNATGMTLGHFPDSFLHSTLGGWIATRSAGMQSDKYGKIEDMVVSLRMVTPSGTIVTRTVPKASNGIDVNHLCIGSEGTLGVITEATMRIHPLPRSRQTIGYLFPDFEGGIAAMHECVNRESMPSMARLSDPDKTALSMAFKPRVSTVDQAKARLFKSYLRVRGFQLPKACLMLTTFSGSESNVLRQMREVNAIYRRFGAANLGLNSGKSFESTKYDFPHIRDFLLDRSITSDVSETSTVWSNISALYRATTEAVRTAIEETCAKPFVGCHISHSYLSGASLYFTFACVQRPEEEMEQYLKIKRAAQQAFMDHRGTLSHHHAVGTEHLPWLEEDISTTGVAAVAALKHGIDPGNVMNPGRLVPSSSPFKDWEQVGRNLKLQIRR